MKASVMHFHLVFFETPGHVNFTLNYNRSHVQVKRLRDLLLTCGGLREVSVSKNRSILTNAQYLACYMFARTVFVAHKHPWFTMGQT